jgi:hypothetical protein
MKDHIALIDQLRGYRRVVNGINRVMKTRVTLEMLNVLDRARREIVDNVNFVAALNVSVA